MNSNGRAQLQFCRDNNADFVSGPSMSSPTCTSHRRNRLNLGVGTSVVDHVHRVKGDATRTPALPACTDHGHATHGPALQLLASGHGAVVVFRGSRAPAAKATSSTRTTWRMGLLHQQQTHEAHQLAVRTHADAVLAILVAGPWDQRKIDHH